jgi:hypothetical protein
LWLSVVAYLQQSKEDSGYLWGKLYE